MPRVSRSHSRSRRRPADPSPTSYEAIGLPPGLTFNADTRVASGTPTGFGTFPIVYRVTDRVGDRASDTFDIDVEEAAGVASDTAGSTDLTYDVATVHRAFEGIDAGAPYGGAPEWEHTSRLWTLRNAADHRQRMDRSRVRSARCRRIRHALRVASGRGLAVAGDPVNRAHSVPRRGSHDRRRRPEPSRQTRGTMSRSPAPPRGSGCGSMDRSWTRRCQPRAPRRRSVGARGRWRMPT